MKSIKLTNELYKILWEKVVEEIWIKHSFRKSDQMKVIPYFEELTRYIKQTVKQNIGNKYNNTRLDYNAFYKKYRDLDNGVAIIKIGNPYQTILFECIGYDNLKDFIAKDKSIPEETIKNQILLEKNKPILNFSSKLLASEDTVQVYEKNEDFEAYFEERLKRAKRVRVIHLSGHDLYSEEGDFKRISYEFISRNDTTWRRIICPSNNKSILRNIEYELKEFKKQNYFVYVIGRIKMADVGIHGFLIIDDEEVCIEGSYLETSVPTLVCKQKSIVRFYIEYFNYLKDIAEVIKFKRGSYNQKLWNELMKRNDDSNEPIVAGDEFVRKYKNDRYFNPKIEERYETAKLVQVISHRDYSTTDHEGSIMANQDFISILNNFINNGNTYERIFSFRGVEKMKETKAGIEAMNPLEGNTNHYYLPNVIYSDLHGASVMIVDEKEVYFHNSKQVIDEKGEEKYTIIGTNNYIIVKFWKDRFKYLKKKAIVIKDNTGYYPERLKRSFQSTSEFWNYFDQNLSNSQKIKVIALNSNRKELTGHGDRTIEHFVKKGGMYQLVITKTDETQQESMKNLLRNTKGHNFHLYYLQQVDFQNVTGIGVMIVDDKTVFMHSGDATGSTEKVIQSNDKALINFWNARFDYLTRKATVVKNNELDINWEVLKTV